MEQIANRFETLDHSASWRDANKKTRRPLTYDEKKAAEAAFRGAPLNAAWSLAARQVYEGISSAMTRIGIIWITPPE